MDPTASQPAAPTAQPSAAPAQAAPSQPAQSDVSLESLLSEFTRETAPTKPEPVAAQPASPTPPEKKAGLDVDALLKDPKAFHDYLNPPISEYEGAELRQRMNQFGSLVQQMARRERHREDSAAFDGIVSKGDAMLKESGHAVGDDYVRRWFMAEASLTPGLAAAFDSRNQSPEHQRQWAKLEKKAYERLLKSARSQPDAEATQTRHDVAAAVRGGCGKGPPAEAG